MQNSEDLCKIFLHKSNLKALLPLSTYMLSTTYAGNSSLSAINMSLGKLKGSNLSMKVGRAVMQNLVPL